MAHQVDWRIFVIWHSHLDLNRFVSDTSFDSRRFTFIRAATMDRGKIHGDASGLDLVEEFDLPDADLSLQKRNYFAAGTIRNLWRSGEMARNSWSGILEYDIDIRRPQRYQGNKLDTSESFGFCSRVDKQLNYSQHPMGFSMQHSLRTLLSQNDIRVNGTPVVAYWDEWWSHRTSTGVNPKPSVMNLPPETRVPLQQSFLIGGDERTKLLEAHSSVVDERVCEKYPKTWKLPATLMERFVAIGLLHMDVIDSMSYVHESQMRWRIPLGLRLHRLGERIGRMRVVADWPAKR